jgi:hypothetical protein
MTKEIDPRDYMAEFLAAGKTVTTAPAGQRTDPEGIVMKFVGGRGRPKNPTPPPAPVKKEKK